MIETLMCHGEITIQDFEFLYELDFRQHFAEAWTQLEKFEEEGLVKLSPAKIELTPLGMLFTRNLAMPFDRHLKAAELKIFRILFKNNNFTKIKCSVYSLCKINNHLTSMHRFTTIFIRYTK